MFSVKMHEYEVDNKRYTIIGIHPNDMMSGVLFKRWGSLRKPGQSSVEYVSSFITSEMAKEMEKREDRGYKEVNDSYADIDQTPQALKTHLMNSLELEPKHVSNIVDAITKNNLFLISTPENDKEIENTATSSSDPNSYGGAWGAW